MGLYVLAKDVSLVSVKVLIIICMTFGHWRLGLASASPAATPGSYPPGICGTQVGRQSRGELPSGAEKVWVETRAAAQVSPRKWLMSLAQFLLNVKSTFMSCWQERMPETLPSQLSVGLSLMLFLTS